MISSSLDILASSTSTTLPKTVDSPIAAHNPALKGYHTRQIDMGSRSVRTKPVNKSSVMGEVNSKSSPTPTTNPPLPLR